MLGARRFAIGLAAALLLAAPARAASFTWTGAAPVTGPSSILWSNAKNWAGGSAPSGSVGALAFPRLTTSGCASMFSSSNACYTTQNDLSGLSVNAITLDAASGYLITGNPLTLGAGGLTAASSAHCPCGSPLIAVPITLGASQGWSVDGYPVNVDGDVSGAAAALRITTSNGADLVLGGNVEVGPVTLAGANAHDPTANGAVLLLGTPPPTPPGPGGPPPGPPPIGAIPAYLNGRDANPVTVSDTTLDFATATIGPLTGADAEIAGVGSPAVGSLTVAGGLSVDRRSAVVFYFDGGRSTHISAAGPVSLGDATVFLDVADSSGFGANQPCQTFPAGAVYTPLTTTGTLTGTFGFIADGDEVVIPCRGGITPAVRVHYTAHAFQVTMLPARGGVLLPQREAAVQRSGLGGVFLACRGPGLCRGKLTLPRGLARPATITYRLQSGATADYDFHLTRSALRRLRRHHGRQRITVTVRPSRGRAFRGSVTLTLQ